MATETQGITNLNLVTVILNLMQDYKVLAGKKKHCILFLEFEDYCLFFLSEQQVAYFILLISGK